MKKYFVLPLLFMVFLCSLAHSATNTAWPIIVAPEEVSQGKDLIGYAFSPFGGTYVEIKHGSRVIWSNFADSYDDEVLFSVRIGRKMTGVLIINAEDMNGNQSSQEVAIVG